MDQDSFIERNRADVLVEVPLGEGQSVWIRRTLVGETDDFIKTFNRPDDPLKREREMAGIIRTEDGSLLFDPKDDQQVRKLSVISMDLQMKIRAEWNKLNGADLGN